MKHYRLDAISNSLGMEPNVASGRRELCWWIVARQNLEAVTVVGLRQFDRLLLTVSNEHLPTFDEIGPLLDFPIAHLVRTVPGRDAMAPPQLAGNAPGLDVLEPVEPRLRPAFGYDPDLALARRLDHRLHQRCGVDIPLVGQPRLD